MLPMLKGWKIYFRLGINNIKNIIHYFMQIIFCKNGIRARNQVLMRIFRLLRVKNKTAWI